MAVEGLLFNVTSGIILGSIYGVSTLGLSLIFGVMRIVNVAHGALIMVGAYTAYWLLTLYGVIPVGSIAVAFLLGFAMGMMLFYIVFRRLLDAPELSSLIATFGIGVFMEEIAKLFWGVDYRGYTWYIGSIPYMGLRLQLSSILAAVLSVATVLTLFIFLYKTGVGTSLRAVVQDPVGAYICGIDVQRVYAVSLGIGLGLTILGGVLLTLYNPTGIYPYMGHPYTLKAFIIAVLGGLGSPLGAFFGGLIFGVIESGTTYVFSQMGSPSPASLALFLGFTLLIIILLGRPEGLMRR
ncbi:MAG TPA: branched-chain amino acid ABC transporter permease [Sulfolobales archaeon]|nr:branched-chain amino acid ABC transporter permease [Sulfolobales archaeon]